MMQEIGRRQWRPARRRLVGVSGRAKATAMAHLMAGVGRLRRHAAAIAQTAVAAAVSWWLAGTVLGGKHAVFAPVTAIVALGITRGHRGRQAVQFVAGVAFGVGVADVAVGQLSPGPIEAGVVCAVAMSAAITLSSSASLVSQAGISAVLAAGLVAPAGGVALSRLWQSLIGGAVALIFSQFLFTPDPVAQLRSAIHNALCDFASRCTDAANSYSQGDAVEGIDFSAPLLRRAIDLRETAEAATATARQAPRRRNARGEVHGLTDRAEVVREMLGDAAPLFRTCSRLAEREPDVRGDLAGLLSALAKQASAAAAGDEGAAASEVESRLRSLRDGGSLTAAAVVALAESCTGALASLTDQQPNMTA